MLSFFPRLFTNHIILLYWALSIVMMLLYPNAVMDWWWIAFGVVEIFGFFYVSSTITYKWSEVPEVIFTKKLFRIALLIRVSYVLFSYIFYQTLTGRPFEFHTGDALFYDEAAKYCSQFFATRGFVFFSEENIYTKGLDISDSGYPLYLSIIYYLTDDSILISRLIKALISSYTCLLMYKLSKRNFGEEIGRMTAIFCMLMPNLIYYCGLSLKETEMLFLAVIFIERVDRAIRNLPSVDWKDYIIIISAAISLFFFRTALGIVALLSLITMAILTHKNIMPLWKKTLVGLVLCIGMTFAIGSQIANESEQLWKASSSNQAASMQFRAERANGNRFAKYASGMVFAPLILTIPFPTMVDIPEQENQQMIHGGNFVKNVLSIFMLYAVVSLLLTGEWRKNVLVLAFTGGYLLVITLSAFAQSERFHLPVLPFELMLAAYGVFNVKAKHVSYFNKWLIALFFINIAWAWFKLKGRGMI